MTVVSVKWFTALAVSATFLACDPEPECKVATDCEAGRACVFGTCATVDSGAGGEAGAGGGTAGAGGEGGGGTASLGPSGGETCALATVIDAGTLMGSTKQAVNDLPGCGQNTVTVGPDVVYQLTIPPGQRLVARVVPGKSGPLHYDPAIYLLDALPSACTPVSSGGLTCLRYADDPMVIASPEVVSYINTGSTPKSVYLVVDSYWAMASPANDADGEGPFTLETRYEEVIAGDACHDPAPAHTWSSTERSDRRRVRQ